MRRIVLAAFALGVLAACQPTATELTEVQKGAIADTVRQLADTYFADARALDFDGMMATYASELVWAENGALGANRDSLATAWRGFFAAIREVTSGNWGEVHVKVLSPTTAVYTASFDWVAVDTSGAATGSHGVWTAVWEQTAEGWKIVYGHESYVPLPAPE